MIAKGWAALKKAAELDVSSADTQDALGMMQARVAQWKLAEQSFKTAITRAPREIRGVNIWRCSCFFHSGGSAKLSIS